MSAAASPCALIALGLFLAFALHLPAATAGAALLLAALPTGTGPFMLAEIYRCEASITARTILISIFTIAIYLHVIAHVNVR
jgi:hypothetical protein